MKVSLQCLLQYITPASITLPRDWDGFHDLLEDIGLEVKRVDQDEVLKDTIITLELLANRGDHHCYYGLAREIHQRTAWPLHYPSIQELPTGKAKPLARVTSDACLAYTLTEYIFVGNTATGKPAGESADANVDVKNQGLSDTALRMIELSGTNQVSPAVDVTNFVNIELGQPMHVFDADKIAGVISVRDSLKGETAQLLGAAKEIELPEGTLVIADEEKILAVAGVMGCETSKPTAESTRLYLESGTFDPVKVRMAARAIGVQSLSSARFERGADPELAVTAVYRAHSLLSKLGWHAQEGLGVCKLHESESESAKFNIKELNHYFATEFQANDVVSIFERMGSPEVQFDHGEFQVAIPSHRRWDLVNSTDLYEEVARAVGYNALQSKMPASASGARPARSHQRLMAVESILVADGFYEIFTDSFYSDQDVARLGVAETQHPLAQHVRINNSETKAYSLLKNNNLVQALDAVSVNLRVKTQQIQVFERNKRFVPDTSAPNGLCREQEVIWGLAAGQSVMSDWQGPGRVFDIFYLKGLIERIAQRLSLDIRLNLQESNESNHPYLDMLHPKRRALLEVHANGAWQVCGVIGEVHPQLMKPFGLKGVRPYFFEIEQQLLKMESAPREYKAPNAILPVKRDLCFGLYQQQEAGYIADWIARSSPWLESVEISDLFESQEENLQPVRAVTFTLMLDPLRANKDVFSGAEINDEIERLAQGVIEHFGEVSVKRR